MAKVGAGAAYQQLKTPDNPAVQVLSNASERESKKRAAEN